MSSQEIHHKQFKENCSSTPVSRTLWSLFNTAIMSLRTGQYTAHSLHLSLQIIVWAPSHCFTATCTYLLIPSLFLGTSKASGHHAFNFQVKRVKNINGNQYVQVSHLMHVTPGVEKIRDLQTKQIIVLGG